MTEALTDRARGRLFYAVLATTSALAAVAGCSMMNPYDHVSLAPRPPVQPEGPTGLRLAGDAAAGLGSAEAMRQIYFNNLKYTAYVRSSTAVLAGGLTGWTLYNALKPGGSGAEAADGDTRRGVRLGATLATLYGLRQVFVNADQESAYTNGYKALTCLMLQSSPLLMTEALNPESPPARAASDANAPLLFYSSPSLGDADRLARSLDQLETRILDVYTLVAKDQLWADAFAEGDKAIAAKQGYLRGQIRESRKALDYARNTLLEGRALLYAVRNVGSDVTNRVGLIVAAVNAQVQSTQHDIAGAKEALGNANDILGAVTSLGSATEADQSDINAADRSPASGNEARGMPAIWLAGPMAAAADVPAAPAGAASANSAAPGKTKRGAANIKTKAKAAAAEPAAEQATAEELQAIRNKLDAALQGIAARQAKAERAAALKQSQDEIDTLKATLDKLQKQSPWESTACADGQKIGCAGELAERTEWLYAARRPVAQALVNFRRAVRAVSATPECSELAALRVTPSEVVRARPGDTVSFLISQRDPGNPFATLNGPADKDKGISFEFKAVEGSSTGLFRADLKVGAQMPRQTIRLVVTNAKGTARREIPIVAGGQAVADPAATPAAVPASAPASAATP